MKYGIYETIYNAKLLVSADLLNTNLYYTTFLCKYNTIQHRSTQKDFAKWLKKMKFKYIGGTA